MKEDIYYIYNLGKFRLMFGTKVYYLLFGFIPIHILTLRHKTRKEKLDFFHAIEELHRKKGKGNIWMALLQ